MEPHGKELVIVRLLKEARGGYVSGEAISHRLGISRTAVWKHIQTLRNSGYHVESSPRKGYRLNPSFQPFNAHEIKSLLTTELVGRNLHFRSSVDSTNTLAAALAKDGAPDGTVVVADSQRSGRGRLGRRWHSPEGVNIYTSVVLRPAIPPHEAHHFTFLAGVAVAGAVEEYSKVRPVLKWPNDILVDGRKLGGILTELSSEADRVNFIVVGIGLNVNMDTKRLPDDVSGVATSLKDITGREHSRAEVLAGLYSSLEKWYKRFQKDGFHVVLRRWKEYFGFEGRRIVVKGREVIEGVCMGVDGDGTLVVTLPSGTSRKVVAGDLEVIE